MKRRILLFICIFIFPSLAPLIAASSASAPVVAAFVDWQKNKIFLEADWRLNGALVQASNAELRAALRSAMLTKLSSVVAGLWSKSASADDERRSSMMVPELPDFWAAQKLVTFQVSENKASASMEIMLRGKESLMAFLPLPFAREIQVTADKEPSATAYEKRPGVGDYDASQSEALLYTGLIIDARHLDYQPSLNTGVFTGSGRQIYGVEYLNRLTAVKRGVAGHYAAETDGELRQRAGKRPLKVSALDLNGHGENSLVISEEDASKLLAHPGSVQNLRRGRVVVLINSAKLKEKY